jgi:hypothetical protein
MTRSAIALIAAILACSLFSHPIQAQKLVDPTTVAPQYREAAEKRRAEQLKLVACSQKVDQANIARRDRAAAVTQCLQHETDPEAQIHPAADHSDH